MQTNSSTSVYIIGGAGSGLGNAIAIALLKKGAHIIALGRSAEKLEVLQNQYSSQADIVCGDITQTETLSHLLQMVSNKHIAGICINAGGPPAATITETSMQDWDMAYQTVLRWKVAMVKALLPQLVAQQYGRLLFIESATVKQPMENLVLSTAFRLAVTGFVKTLSNEVAAKGITANILAPGLHDTPAIERVFKKKQTQTGLDRQAIQETETEKIPVHKLGNAQQFAQLALWLMSEDAGYITGQTISVDGGMVKGIFG
ncbi:SDR family oxidoreductase [Hydrotalea sp.]|uniref:SDR family oxidoreductase n=1 Tax=Hydrotalea sp. TaxID=2881279 RepID=UPI00261774E6|nr:SDR family oxidoreductase [Hydrotalea sp.]